MNRTEFSGAAKDFTNGRNNVVSAGLNAVQYSTAAALSPATDCHRYFHRAMRPRELPTTSFR
jgi:hypothetical protein